MATQSNRRMLRALLATTSLFGAASVHAQTTPETTATAEEIAPNDIIVTAQKRAESLQSVPLSIQALGEERLDELQVRNFADYVKYLPSANYTTGGIGTPGNSSVIFRGIATDGGLYISGSLPTVGTYLDEQPITSISGTVDVHIYDVARVEALAGPQGTLYGASSQAGTIRIITNKPDPTRFSAGYDLELNQILKGGVGGQAEAFVNIPIATDRVALRAVGWYSRTGGYIDNVFRSRVFPTSGIVQTNERQVKDDHNPVEVYGLRAQLGIDLDENWTITPSVIAQRTEWEGSFQSDDDKVGELKVAHVFPEFGTDEFYQAGGTITGRISDFEVTYAGYYLERRRDDQNDYADYGFFYDLVSGSGAGVVNDAGQLIDPSQINRNKVRLTKHSQEVRIATPSTGRLRAVAGLFYQRQTQREQNDYLTPGFATRLSVPGRPGQVWLTLQDRIDRDYAAFGQADLDLTDKLTVTGGARLYKYDNSLVGFFGVNTTYFGTGVRQCLGRAGGGGPFGVGIAVVPGTPCTNLGVLNSDGSISPKESKGDGVTWRGTATYKFSPDNLIWFTASSGFRPGGVNRAGTAEPFGADELFNYEIGSKNSFWNRRVTANLVVFQSDWKNVQVLYQPQGSSGVALIGNVGSARSRGFEVDIGFQPNEALSLRGALTYTDAKLEEAFVLFGTVTAPAGQPLPLTPKLKSNLTARYELPFGSGIGHVQFAAAYIGERNSVISTADLRKLGKLPEYATLDAVTGFRRGNSRFEIYARNLTDVRGQQSRAARCNINVCGPSARDPVGEIYRIYIQPRTIGVRFGQNF